MNYVITFQDFVNLFICLIFIISAICFFTVRVIYKKIEREKNTFLNKLDEIHLNQSKKLEEIETKYKMSMKMNKESIDSNYKFHEFYIQKIVHLDNKIEALYNISVETKEHELRIDKNINILMRLTHKKSK